MSGLPSSGVVSLKVIGESGLLAHDILNVKSLTVEFSLSYVAFVFMREIQQTPILEQSGSSKERAESIFQILRYTQSFCSWPPTPWRIQEGITAVGGDVNTYTYVYSWRTVFPLSQTFLHLIDTVSNTGTGAQKQYFLGNQSDCTVNRAIFSQTSNRDCNAIVMAPISSERERNQTRMSHYKVILPPSFWWHNMLHVIYPCQTPVFNEKLEQNE